MTVEPRHHTPRNPSRPTRGGAVARVAAAIGHPPMPWQRLAYDVTGELDPANGQLWYDTVVMRVQRQAGKTDTVGVTAIERALRRRRARLWYTSQTGGDAGEWMREEFFSLIDIPLFAGKCKMSRRAGKESATWTHNGSKFQAFPPVKKAMHSKQSDFTCVDEAWSFTAEQGRELRQAIRPTMSTRRGSQLWVVSAAGDDSSEYLAEYVELGKLSLLDPDSRTCFIDYGIPADADPEDLEVIAAYHPAVGHTIDMSHIVAARADFGRDSAGFARAYGTRDTAAREAAFPAGAWTECGGGRIDPAGPVHLAIDCTPDGQRLAVLAAWSLGDPGADEDLVAIELLYAGPVESPAALEILRRTHTLDPIVYDPASPATLDVVDQLAALDIPTRAVSTAQLGQACAGITRRVIKRTLRHFHQSDLDAAVELAGKRPLADGAFAWSRLRSSGSIAELVAATLAVREADAPTKQRRKPVARH